jgi:hypothetical protein
MNLWGLGMAWLHHSSWVFDGRWLLGCRDFALWVQCSWRSMYSRLWRRVKSCVFDFLWRNKTGDVLNVTLWRVRVIILKRTQQCILCVLESHMTVSCAAQHSVCVGESHDSCAAQQCFYGKFISAATVQITLAGWGRNVGWGCLRIGCWGEYLGLRGTR